MTKCSICGKEIIDDDDITIYGIIEEYHYDSRITTMDTDYGPTTYKPIAIVKADMCRECGVKATKGLLMDTLKTFGGSLLAIIIGLLTNRLSNEFSGLIAFVGVLGIFVSIGMLVKSFLPNSKIKKIFNGKVSKENVIYPISDEDLDIEDIPGDNYNRHHYKYKFINEEKLNKPEKETKHTQSYDAALNILKKWYKENYNEVKSGKVENKTVKENKIKEKPKNKLALDSTKEKVASIKPDEENKKENKEKTSSIFNTILAKLKTIPKLVYYILGGLVGISLIVVLVVSIFSKDQIRINDYLVYNTFGNDGEATTEIYVDYDKMIDEVGDSIKLKDNYQSIEVTDGNQETLNIIVELLDKCLLTPSDLVYFFYLDNDVEMSEYLSEYEYYLSEVLSGYAIDDNVRELRHASFFNECRYAYISKGSEISYAFNHNFEFINNILEKPIICEDGTYIVDDIKELVEIDFKSYIHEPYVEFDGPNGLGTAKISYTGDLGEGLYNDGRTSIYIEGFESNDFEFVLGQNGDSLVSLKYEIENSNYLSNGDTVTLTLINAELLKEYGLYAKDEIIEVTVSGLPEVITDAGGEMYTSSMIENYIRKQLYDEYGYDYELNSLDIISAIYFKTPDEIETDEPITIVVDYSYDLDYPVDGTVVNSGYKKCFGTIYNPSIADGEIFATRYEVNDADEFYKPLKDEFAFVDINEEIDDYGDFLELLASSAMDKLISAGIEDKDTVEAIRYLLLNDSLYIIID